MSRSHLRRSLLAAAPIVAGIAVAAGLYWGSVGDGLAVLVWISFGGLLAHMLGESRTERRELVEILRATVAGLPLVRRPTVMLVVSDDLWDVALEYGRGEPLCFAGVRIVRSPYLAPRTLYVASDPATLGSVNRIARGRA